MNASDLSTQQELLKFASSYGNCIVEKAFFGGVLCLCFKKGARGEADGFEVELGRDVFSVTWQHRGGGPLKVDTKKPMSCDQLEKLLRNWAKSCGAFKAKKSVVVVRLKLAPSSKAGKPNHNFSQFLWLLHGSTVLPRNVRVTVVLDAH